MLCERLAAWRSWRDGRGGLGSEEENREISCAKKRIAELKIAKCFQSLFRSMAFSRATSFEKEPLSLRKVGKVKIENFSKWPSNLAMRSFDGGERVPNNCARVDS